MGGQGGRNVPLEMLTGLLPGGKALWEGRSWGWLSAETAEGTAQGRQEPRKAIKGGDRAEYLAQPAHVKRSIRTTTRGPGLPTCLPLLFPPLSRS